MRLSGCGLSGRLVGGALLGVSLGHLAPVWALPSGAEVVGGNATVQGGGTQMIITQGTPAAIVNWTDFSIGAGERVEVIQLGASAALLNRVTGADPSRLLGSLNANGRVYLVNPNGVLVGADARIDAAGFVATTANIDNAAFLAQGELTFSGGSNADVVNLGVIRASEGDVVLVASRVVNQGRIEAPAGTAALAAATEFVYAPLGDEAIRVIAAPRDAQGGVGVDNAGLLDAAQAQLLAADGNLYALAVNQSGVVRATGIERRGGRVVLTAEGGTVRLDGTITARNADGSGGEVLVGGDFHGANPEVANAAYAQVGAGAVIDVSATAVQADGGTAVVWSDQQTDFAGRIDGRAGAQGGDGGLAEVSGKQVLNYQGLVDLTAPHGKTGVLLLDPSSLAINATGPDSAGVQLSSTPVSYGQQNGTTTSILTVATLEAQLALSSVILDTSDTGPTLTDIVNTTTYTVWTDGSIEVNAPLSWSSGSTLTFNSGNSIYVNADIDAGTNGSIVFGLGSEEEGTQIIVSCIVPARAAELVVDAAASITADTLTIKPGTISGASSSYASLGNPGRIAIAGALNVGTLAIEYPLYNTSVYGYSGINGAVTIDNPANQIDVLSGVTDSGVIGGDFKVVDSAGGLTVTGNLFGYAGARIDIVTQGDLTLASGTRITTGINNYGVVNGPYSDIALAARGGAFINNAGANAVDAAGSGRFLIYSATPTRLVAGGLLGTPVYNKHYAVNAPTGITQSGDRFLYELAPVLTITADSLSREYGEANPTLTYQVSGLVAGDTAAAVYAGSPSLATTLDAGSGAGSYTDAITVTQGGLTLSDYDYGFAGVAGDLTITKALLSITPNAATRLYGALDPALSGTIVGFKNGEALADLTTAPVYLSASTSASPVGSYSITASGAASPNYTFSYQPGTDLFTITPAPLTITADNAAIKVGDPLPDPASYSATFLGLVAGDLASDYAASLGFTNQASDSSASGSFAITPGGVVDANYSITFVDGTLTIGNQILTVTADSLARLYGQANPAFSASYLGFVNGDDASVLTTPVSFTTSAVVGSSVGTYAIVPGGASAANYDMNFVNGTLTINPAALTIRATDASRRYGAANPAFSASYIGLVAGDSAADLPGLSVTSNALVGSPVGNGYTITPAGAVNANYTISYQSGSLSVTPAPLTITANAASRVYGAADPVFSATFGGLVAGDSAADISGLSLTSDALVDSPVGSGYSITPAGANNPNYSYTYVGASYSITPAALRITAIDATRRYGDADPAFSASYSGLVAGDTAADIIGLGFTSAAADADVGSYSLIPGGASNPNYSISYQSGSLTITRRPATITAPDVTYTYGDAVPSVTTSVSGLASFDTRDALGIISLTSDGLATGADAGSYPLTPSSWGSTNYSISYQPGMLTVAPRPATITALDATRLYGDADPSFGVSYDGIFASEFDAALVTIASSAQLDSDIGRYAITPSAYADPNYAVSFVAGTLRIDPAPLQLQVDPSTRVYGDPNPAFSYTLTGLKFNESAASVIRGGSWQTTAQPDSAVGDYVVDFSGAGAVNYALVTSAGTLSITPRPITLSVADVSRLYGYDNPSFTLASSSNLLPELDPVEEVVSLSSTAGRFSYVGNYPITATLLDANYSLTATSGTLTIDPIPVNLVVDDITRYYGEENPFFFPYQVVDTTLPEGVVMEVSFNFGTLVDTNAGSPVGFYQITNRGAVLDTRRFTLNSLQTGVMTVLPRPVTLVPNSLNVTYPFGADPIRSILTSELPFGASVEGALPGDTVASLFPLLTYELFSTTNSTTVVSADYASTYAPPSAEAFSAGFAPLSSAELPTSTLTFAVPKSTSSFVIVGHEPTLIGITLDNYLGQNPNYVVTGVRPGTLTLREQIQLSDSNSELVAMLARPQPTLVVRSQSDYRSNAIYYLQDNAERAEAIISDYLKGLDDPRSDELYQALFGEGEMDPAKIRAWVAGAASDEEKRLLLVAPMKSYLLALQAKDPSTYSGAEQNLVAAVEAEMAEQYRDLGQAVLAAQQAWYAQKGGASSMSDLYDGVEPYGEFIRDGMSDYAVEAFSAGAIAKTAAAGGAVAAAGTGVAIAAATAHAALFPFTKVMTSASSVGGPIGVAVAVVVTVTVIRTIELIEAENEHRDFDAVVDTGNSYHAFGSMNLDSNDQSLQAMIDQLVFSATLNNMLGW